MDDIVSRLSSISDSSGPLAAYKYLGRGTIVREDYEQPGVALDYDPDGDHSFSGLDRFGRVVDQLWADDTWNPLDEYRYTYDRAGNRTSRENAVSKAQGTPVYLDELYTYDALDQLAGTQRGNLVGGQIQSQNYAQDWTLDALGNWSAFDDNGDAQAREHNAANEIQSVSGTTVTPSYDQAGNMISGPSGHDATVRIHYVYDAWNRLVAVKADDSGQPGDTIATYSYDAQNRRVEKIVAGESDAHYYYNQNWQLLEEVLVDGQGAAIATNQYVWSARYIDSPIVCYHDANADGDYLDTGDTIRYYTTDANHNVTTTITIDHSGTDMQHVAYDAYGQAQVYAADWTGATAPTTDGPLYCGYFFDAETGNYLARNRYYTVVLATWMSRDPIAYKGGSNLYRYVGNSPVDSADPSGLVDPNCDIPVWGDNCAPPNMPPLVAPPDPKYTAGFKICQRDIKKTGDCCEDAATGVINACYDQHCYIQYGALNKDGTPAQGTEGWGIGGGGAGTLPSSEDAFHADSCTSLTKGNSPLKYGTGAAAGKTGATATDAEIKDCISKVPMSKKYVPWGTDRYNCRDWAKEAAAACGLQ